MPVTTAGRGLLGGLPRIDGRAIRGVRQAFRHFAARDRRSRAFARYVAADLIRYVAGGLAPVAGDTERRGRLAARWLSRAGRMQPATTVCRYGYFPFKSKCGWRES